ncbi:adenosylmethionine decarboxylase [Synechococcus sp. PCC 7336]|uniref:adenosylmethionine decarboxylase n=1 Tax=Synechococcus sp. PCC 7336 TaxID=195250 RepID=UPI0003477088|nr:adenosylmethionine decarboxylase [Synechococcus sp. PCC 7336]
MAIAGIHCILDLYGCPPDLLNDLAFVKQTLKEAVARSQATLIRDINHQFEPCGITAIALLAESHLSVHTWPEEGYVAIDAFTCGTSAQPDAACQYLICAFKASSHSYQSIARHIRATPTAATAAASDRRTSHVR